MEEGGFTVVKRKHDRRPKNSQTPIYSTVTVATDGDEDVDEKYVTKRIAVCRDEIYHASYYKTLKDQLHKISLTLQDKCESSDGTKLCDLGSNDLVSCDLVSYGIGHFASCLIARYQLALLLLLREDLKVPSGHCSVYDPAFNKAEIKILKELGCDVLDENEEGKRVVSDKRTVFYMPHCGKPLYNNLLWANWDPLQLSNLIIIGNSFSNIQISSPERLLKTTAGYILKILPYTNEVPLENTFQFQHAFNDTAVHIFPRHALDGAPASLWEDREEPVYDEHKVEIVLAHSKR